MLLTAIHRNSFSDGIAQTHSFFFIEKLEAEHCIADQFTHIQGHKIHLDGSVIHPRHFQHILHKAAHLVGCGQDVLGELLFILLRGFFILHQFRVRHNDRKGCF